MAERGSFDHPGNEGRGTGPTLALNGVLVFVRAAELGSFTRAASVLQMTSSGVGKAISRLEDELRVRLMHRTTRRVTLTDEGALFFEQCRRALDGLAIARQEIASRSAEPRGRLRVSLPVTIGKRVVVPALPAFVRQHPDITLEVRLSDRGGSTMSCGGDDDDADVFVVVGSLADSSLVARLVGHQRLVTLAAPSLLAEREPRSPDELAEHRCVSFRAPGASLERAWLFHVEGAAVELRPPAFLIIDDEEALVSAAASGLGLCQVPEHMARDELRSGALVEVLSPFAPPPEAIHALHASQRNSPARIRAFVDFLCRLSDLDRRDARASVACGLRKSYPRLRPRP